MANLLELFRAGLKTTGLQEEAQPVSRTP